MIFKKCSQNYVQIFFFSLNTDYIVCSGDTNIMNNNDRRETTPSLLFGSLHCVQGTFLQGNFHRMTLRSLDNCSGTQ